MNPHTKKHEKSESMKTKAKEMKSSAKAKVTSADLMSRARASAVKTGGY